MHRSSLHSSSQNEKNVTTGPLQTMSMLIVIPTPVTVESEPTLSLPLVRHLPRSLLPLLWRFQSNWCPLNRRMGWSHPGNIFFRSDVAALLFSPATMTETSDTGVGFNTCPSEQTHPPIPCDRDTCNGLQCRLVKIYPDPNRSPLLFPLQFPIIYTHRLISMKSVPTYEAVLSILSLTIQLRDSVSFSVPCLSPS